MSPYKGLGLGEHSAHYRQHMDTTHMPPSLHVMNHFVCRTFQNSVYFLKWTKMFGILEECHLGFCRIAIRTSNYCVLSHVDKFDKETRSKHGFNVEHMDGNPIKESVASYRTRKIGKCTQFYEKNTA